MSPKRWPNKAGLDVDNRVPERHWRPAEKRAAARACATGIDPRLIPFCDAIAEMLVDWVLQDSRFASVRQRLEASSDRQPPRLRRKSSLGE